MSSKAIEIIPADSSERCFVVPQDNGGKCITLIDSNGHAVEICFDKASLDELVEVLQEDED